MPGSHEPWQSEALGPQWIPRIKKNFLPECPMLFVVSDGGHELESWLPADQIRLSKQFLPHHRTGLGGQVSDLLAQHSSSDGDVSSQMETWLYACFAVSLSSPLQDPAVPSPLIYTSTVTSPLYLYLTDASSPAKSSASWSIR